ncbi:MAG: ribbon-helix-helix domain-containing protein [Hyphomicrobiaceae bacterium]|nr:ribbon-helix-helix domain-containing protein [Hyphomicrobiaceae bacterium]
MQPSPGLEMPADGYKQPSREGKVALTVHVDLELRLAVKQLALDERTTVQELLEETLQELVKGKKRAKPRG